ncbi:MAG: class I SAM-dependent methyltransferase [Acidobacteria bacterium]|nr:class I SAM-dependent methyltransferase [Acidobacteriota bacterium]
MSHRKRDTCRLCGDRRLKLVIELGPMPLANAFLRSPDDFASEPRFPLGLSVCESCALVQLVDVIEPEVLFRDYIYVTGISDTISRHNLTYAAALVERLHLGPSDLVIEVASNDGSLLQAFARHGVRTLGIEPARNIAALARQAGIETIDRFFDATLARDVRDDRGPARAVLANNVLAHVDDPVDFLRGCRELVAEDGLIAIEVPSLGDLLDRLEYDTIYHEHLCYFSVTTLARLCDRAELRIASVRHVPVHGGSLRLYVSRSAGPRDPDLEREVRDEHEAGLSEWARYEAFGRDVHANRAAIRSLLTKLREEGKTLAAYGAPAKSTTLLNFCGIGPDGLPYTVDKNPMKVGRYTPGTHLPILPVSTLAERRPDYTMILVWNLADEIVRQEQAYLDGRGRFLVPLPAPRVV